MVLWYSSMAQWYYGIVGPCYKISWDRVIVVHYNDAVVSLWNHGAIRRKKFVLHNYNHLANLVVPRVANKREASWLHIETWFQSVCNGSVSAGKLHHRAMVPYVCECVRMTLWHYCIIVSTVPPYSGTMVLWKLRRILPRDHSTMAQLVPRHCA